MDLNTDSIQDMFQQTKQLNKKFKWIKDCVQKYDVTEISETYDLKYIFDEAKKQEKEKEKNKNKENER